MDATTEKNEARTPLTQGKIVTVFIIIGIVLFHMVATVVYTFPSGDYQRNVKPQTFAYSYMRPFFHQDYKIFAPNPISQDRSLRVRAWVQPDVGGDPVTTEWINVSELEIHDIHRRVLRKQQSIYGAENLAPAYRALSQEQREVALGNYHRTSFEQLAEDLYRANPDGSRAVVQRFIQQSRFAVAMATQVAYAFWDDQGDILAVQVMVVYEPVPTWENRFEVEGESATPIRYVMGWRPLLEYPGQSREAFAETMLNWSEE